MAIRMIAQFALSLGRWRALPVGVLSLAFLAAMDTAGQAQPNRIDSVSVVAETANSVTFEIIYAYGGDQGNDVFLSVTMAHDGELLPHYSYRPGPVRSGQHRARVELSAARRAPELFSSDQINVGMYVGGQSPFLERTFSYPKTWSRPRAELRAVPNIIAVQAVPPVITVPATNLSNRLANPSGGSSGGGEAVERRVRSDGSIWLRFPDGSERIRTEGRETIIHPNGTQSVNMNANAQPPTPPGAPPNATHSAWVQAELESQLQVIRILVGHDDASIGHYLAQEGANWSPYRRITQRTWAIDMLVSP